MCTRGHIPTRAQHTIEPGKCGNSSDDLDDLLSLVVLDRLAQFAVFSSVHSSKNSSPPLWISIFIMQRKNIHYNAASVTATDDSEEDGVFWAAQIAIEKQKVGHSPFGSFCNLQQWIFIVETIIIITSTISFALGVYGLYTMKTMNGSLFTVFTVTNVTPGRHNGSMALSGGFGKNDNLQASAMQQIAINNMYTIQATMGTSILNIWSAGMSIYSATKKDESNMKMQPRFDMWLQMMTRLCLWISILSRLSLWLITLYTALNTTILILKSS